MEDPSKKPAVIRQITTRPKRLYAIGDLHGCAEELQALLTCLKSEHQLAQDDQVIFIGDYIDRGPDSKGVIDTLLRFREEYPHSVFLKGNHEDMLLSYLGLGGRGGEIYLSNGGMDCFRSYKITPYTDPQNTVSKLPEAHVEFFKSLELGVTLAEFIFVHAGLNPSKALDQQSEEDLLWIRSDFTENIHSFGKTVVFGHTPFEDIFLHLPYKIGIDTGVIYGNQLSCVELVEGTLFQVICGDKKVKSSSLRERLGSTS